jgi:hypothetical protein
MTEDEYEAFIDAVAAADVHDEPTTGTRCPTSRDVCPSR